MSKTKSDLRWPLINPISHEVEEGCVLRSAACACALWQVRLSQHSARPATSAAGRVCADAPDALQIQGKPHHADIVNALAVQGKGSAAPARRAVEGDAEASITLVSKKKAGYNKKVELSQL